MWYDPPAMRAAESEARTEVRARRGRNSTLSPVHRAWLAWNRPALQGRIKCLGSPVPGRFNGLFPYGFSHGRTTRKLPAGKRSAPGRPCSHIHVKHPSALGACLEPRRGGGNKAQGRAEGGTLGTESNQVEPCKGDRNAFFDRDRRLDPRLLRRLRDAFAPSIEGVGDPENAVPRVIERRRGRPWANPVRKVSDL